MSHLSPHFFLGISNLRIARTWIVLFAIIQPGWTVLPILSSFGSKRARANTAMRVSQTLDSTLTAIVAFQGLIAASSGTFLALGAHHVMLTL